MCAHIEASLHGTRIAFLPNQLAILILLLFVQPLCGADREITVVQLHRELFFLEARQINVQLIAVLFLMHIGLHQHSRAASVQLPLRLICPFQCREIKPIIKQIITKQARYEHTLYLLHYLPSLSPTVRPDVIPGKEGSLLIAYSLFLFTVPIIPLLLALSIGECQ